MLKACLPITRRSPTRPTPFRACAVLWSDAGPVPVFGSNGIVGYTDEPLTVHPAIIVGRKGSAGALQLCGGPSWTTDVAYFVETPSFFAIRFLLHALAALDLDKLGKGVKPGLSRSDAYEQVLCIPPLPEQHRIVAKVEELMALCDRLEAGRQTREAMRDRLTSASLGRLNAPDPDSFRDDARFALDALPALTARADQIKQLRQTILNLAVRGKLVPQDPDDEPASELLKRIGAQTNHRDFDAEHELPTSWAWALIEDCFAVSGGMQKTPARTPRTNAFPYLGVGNVYRGRLDLGNVKKFELAAGELERFRLEPGDILVVEGNGSANEIGAVLFGTARSRIACTRTILFAVVPRNCSLPLLRRST
jgi:type I restriction enzyme, S subunit